MHSPPGLFSFLFGHNITIPKGKLASAAPLKGSPEDGLETPDGACKLVGCKESEKPA
jgi:hypothetical protein